MQSLANSHHNNPWCGATSLIKQYETIKTVLISKELGLLPSRLPTLGAQLLLWSEQVPHIPQY